MGVRTKLEELTEILNGRLREAERAIEERGYGVSASTEFTGDLKGMILFFEKYKNEWRFVVRYPNGNVGALLEASRAIRVAAVKLLPAIISALEREHDRQAEEVNEMVQTADLLIRRLRAR